MAYIFNKKAMDENIKNLVSRVLCNQCEAIAWQYDYMYDTETAMIRLKNAEVFGKEFKVELRAKSTPHKIQEAVMEVLKKSIEHLPRIDRIERERVWGIK